MQHVVCINHSPESRGAGVGGRRVLGGLEEEGRGGGVRRRKVKHWGSGGESGTSVSHT